MTAKILEHTRPSLTRSARHQTEAATDGWEATYRQMVLYDLAADIELDFFFAYYRNFAVPSLAATLHQNGEITERPMKRSYDTAVVTYELISCGLNSDRGRHMIRLVNHVHRNVPGSQDDFLYVLLTLLASPSAGCAYMPGGHQHQQRKPLQLAFAESSAPA